MAKFIIGIDEVGRGALAGPVTVTALALSYEKLELLKEKKFQIESQKGKAVTLTDSKKLTEKERELWAEFVFQEKIIFKTTNINPEVIDEINILQATNLGAQKSFEKILKQLEKDFNVSDAEIFLDGGLSLKGNYKYQAIIKGDEKIPAISLASIIAKVSRDKLMQDFDKEFTGYQFKTHKGYGTKKHYEAIEKNGVSALHRKTFLKKIL